MGCRSDYMEPSQREKESKLVCTLLKYLLHSMGQSVPARITKAAEETYGEVFHLDQDTDLLCSLCKEMSDEQAAKHLYDGRNAEARRLADWWDHHQEADRKREEVEAKSRVTKIHTRKPISPADLRKLTDQAIERGQIEHQDELQRIAEKETRQRRADELKAEGIIMQIPSKCEKEARNQRTHAVVMGLRYLKDHDQLGGTTLDATKLKGAGRIVFDYCKDAELQPTLEYWWSGDGMDSGYNIVVHW